MKLIAINPDGTLDQELALSDLAKEIIPMCVGNYQKNGFQKPWCSYIVTEQEAIVGTCAFKTPPVKGKVEIAYFTFPEFEGKGIATCMANELIQLAQVTDRTIKVTARTLPEKNASTSILTKLGFENKGIVTDPEDGEVWEWELPQ